MERSEELKRIHEAMAEKEKGYRARALKLFPHICGSCGREFSGKNLKELTVHHKDHDHNNNPPDGSNWELLCLYCHDHEHEKHKMKGYGDATGETFKGGEFSAFKGLDGLLNLNSGDEDKH